MSHKFFVKLLITLFSVAFVNASFANSIAQELSEKLGLLQSFQGEFQQTLKDSNDQLLQETSGQFVLVRPGFFRWETQQPFPQLLISNLETIWLYDPDLEQVTVKPYDQSIAQTPALLLSGDAGKISQYYKVENKKLEKDQIEPAGNTSYRLLPLDKDALFTELIVDFELKQEQQQLIQMLLIDSLGQTTTFRFINGRYNQPIDKQQFNFVPPTGTDVIIGN